MAPCAADTMSRLTGVDVMDDERLSGRGSSAVVEDRSPAAVLADHLERRASGDVEGDIEANYHADVVVLSPVGLAHGHDGVRASAERLESDLPDAEYAYEMTVCESDACFLSWTAEAPSGRITVGVDAFVIRAGKIVVQTAYYLVQYGD